MRLAARTILLAVGWAVTSTCATSQLYSDCLAPSSQCPGLEVDDQEAVLFLVGDPGSKEFDNNPVLQHMETAIAELDRRGVPVTVLFLGDNVYEEGVRDDHPEDLLLLEAQVRVVTGTAARGIFLAGNHDWGNTGKNEGLTRLMNQERALADFRTAGVNVSPRPRAGCLGPARENLENSNGDVLAALILLDTPWWTLEPQTDPACGRITKDAVIAEVERLVEGVSDVPVIVAAHHPLRSGGPHGGNASFLRLLANRIGLLREDLNTGPYRALIESLSEVFARTSRPVIYAAGHEHSLQVIDELDQAAAVLHLVSGSGSKVTGAKAIDGSRFTAGLPGYMRLDFRAGGRIQLGVIAECSEEAVVANICSVGGGRFQSVYRTFVPEVLD